MASYTDQQLLGSVQRQLQPGENVVSVAFGHKPMNIGLQIFCMLGVFAAILPGLILFLVLNAIVTKNYVVALTDRRLIINEVGGGLAVKSTMELPLPVQGRITAAPKGNFIEFALFAQRSVDMKFFRNNGPTNYNNAQMIVQALQQGQMGGPMGAGQPGYGGPPQMGPGAPGGQLPPQGGGYGPPQGGGYGPPPGGGYGPPGGGAPPGGGGYGPPGGGAPPGGGGYGPPPGGGYGPPPGGGYGPPGGGGGYGPS